MNSTINNNGNINFRTNIKFISPKDFNKVKKNFIFKYFCPATYNYLLEDKIQTKKCYRIWKEKNYTQEIRNCTGVVIINAKKKLTSFFAHFFPCPRNCNRLSNVKQYMNGTNAILVGSKSTSTFSKEMYDSIKDICQNKKLPVSEFKDLAQEWEADIAYDAKKDNLYICLKEILLKKNCTPKYVNNMDELKIFCKTITISEKDNIEFIKDGNLQTETWGKWIISKLYFLLGKEV